MYDVVLIVAPVFGLIALGYGLARFAVLSEDAGKGLAEFVFTVAVPALLFRMMVTAEMAEGASPIALWGSYFGSAAVIWLLAVLATHYLLLTAIAGSRVRSGRCGIELDVPDENACVQHQGVIVQARHARGIVKGRGGVVRQGQRAGARRGVAGGAELLDVQAPGLGLRGQAEHGSTDQDPEGPHVAHSFVGLTSYHPLRGRVI